MNGKPMEPKDVIANGRLMLKPDWASWDGENTDQKLGKPMMPPHGGPEGVKVRLMDFAALEKKSLPFIQCVKNRRSKRKYTEAPLTLEELSYLVWAASGIREIRSERPFRTYPSGGNTQALSAYMFIENVGGVQKGLYKHLPHENALVLLDGGADVKERLSEAANTFNAQLFYIWTAEPYRAEWRYSTVSHKMIAMEAGHACQNLYLAAESLSMGCVAIAAFDQKNADAFLGLDGEEEFVIYMAAAGR